MCLQVYLCSKFSRGMLLFTWKRSIKRLLQLCNRNRRHSPELCLLIPPGRPRPDLITAAPFPRKWPVICPFDREINFWSTGGPLTSQSALTGSAERPRSLCAGFMASSEFDCSYSKWINRVALGAQRVCQSRCYSKLEHTFLGTKYHSMLFKLLGKNKPYRVSYVRFWIFSRRFNSV